MKDSLVADSSRYGICIGFGSLLEYQNLNFSNNALADLDNDACN